MVSILSKTNLSASWVQRIRDAKTIARFSELGESFL